MYDLLIVGGGPAALSAAFYALGKRLKVVMVYEELGGQLGWRRRFAGPNDEHDQVSSSRTRIADAFYHERLRLEDEDLPGNEVVRLLISRTTMQAGQVISDRVLQVVPEADGFGIITRHHGTLQSATVIIASGASPVPLDVPGAQRIVGPQLGYSITTYAHLMIGKRVAVIGSTLRALRGCAELVGSASQLTLIASGDDLAQSSVLDALRQQPSVEVLLGYTVKEILGSAATEGVVVEGPGGRREIDTDRVFVDLGLRPNSSLVQGLVETDGDGFIVIDDNNGTSVPGIFAGGDVTTSFCEQVLLAIGDGARAAMHAYDYLLTRRLQHPPVVRQEAS